MTPRPRRAVLMATSPLFFRWFMEGHVRRLRGAGWDVRLVSGDGPELAPFAARTGAPAHPIPLLEREIRPRADLRAFLGLLSLLRRLRPDLVHASTPKAGLLGMVAAWLLRVPARVYHCHGLRYETSRGLLRAVLWGAERTACALATRVLAVSGSLADALVARGLCAEEKLEVLHRGSVSGVDAQGRFVPAPPEARRAARRRLGLPEDARVLGFVGRVVRDKGVPVLWEAWRALREALPDLHWVLVGPVEAGDPVTPEVLAAMRADPRVHLLGQDEDTPPLLAAMDVVALPSWREGFGLVVAEAGAMGLPVVATRVTGIVDAVADGEAGALVPPGDAAALAAALRRYLEDPALSARHGAAGRARVLRDFEPAALEQALLERYERWSGGPAAR
ncbi:MAG: glycosyltransferase family 4 protein [Anaeromyxobacteraceae bacterium]|nr:glycosyltransferase family 4 protein [Anaeromyxobacteraceae bacterium]